MPSWLTNALGPKPSGRVVARINRTPTAPAPSSGGGGGGAPAFDINALMASLQGQQGTANAAGEARYNTLLSNLSGLEGRIGGMYDEAGALTAGRGTAGAARIEDNRVRSQGSATQDLTTRGLGNTTIVDSVKRGINADAERSNQELQESVNTQRAGLLTQRAGAEMGLGQLRADATLSRNDTGPNSALYAQLIQQLMQNGGGGSGGGWQSHMGPAPGYYWSDYSGPRG